VAARLLHPRPFRVIRTAQTPGLWLRRYAQPEEVAELMLFPASDESAFCTGGVYMVDGGERLA
jgi:NAD(P)-dependent dehydrogenase (short-subunit alcohol dehydrogenase family)